MSPNTWLTFFKILSYVGLFIVFVSTVGIGYFTSKIDKEKDNKIDELVKGNRHLISQDKEKSNKLDEILATLVSSKKISKETAKDIKKHLSDTVSLKDDVQVEVVKPKKIDPPNNNINKPTPSKDKGTTIKDQIEFKIKRGNETNQD